MQPLITIIGMGLITYAIRVSLMAAMPGVVLGKQVRQALSYVPPAVLSAIIFPEILRPAGALDLSLSNVRLLAGAIAFLVAWRTENALHTVFVGMLALWGIGALFG